MDRMDELLKRHYREVRDDLLGPKGECPEEALLWKYAEGRLGEQEREAIDGHLAACSACLETLAVIRMLRQAEGVSREVPAPLHHRALEVLRRAVEAPGLQPKGHTMVLRLSLLWDRARNRITQCASDLGEALTFPEPQLQPVRNGHEPAVAFPYTRSADTDVGRILLALEPAGREGYLSLKVSFRPKKEHHIKDKGAVRAVLYKEKRVCASVCLGERGEALFPRIREGAYAIELLAGDTPLGMVELSIGKGP